jgi:hypothetical protein
MPLSVSKNQLRNYLKTFIDTYRNHIKKEYPAYSNQFPFYEALKAIGVITHNRVYVIFTKDDKPRKTSIDVFDADDIPDLMRVKDAKNPKWEDIFALLNIETYILDIPHFDFYSSYRMTNDNYWTEAHAPNVALQSVQFHYDYVESQEDPTIFRKGEKKPPTIMLRYTFVYNTIDQRSLRNKVEEIFDIAEEGEEILITGWIGSFAVPLLNSLEDKNVKFRIITHKPTPPERGKNPSDEYVVFAKILTQKYPENVRILTNLHGRLLISDKESLVSSADLTKDSQEGKYETGIGTTDGLAILELKKFFEEMWNRAEPLKT